MPSNGFDSHRLVLHQLHLQPCDLRPEGTDLLAGPVLVNHHLVLDVSGTVGVLKGVQSLHEVAVRRAGAGDHHCLAEGQTNLISDLSTGDTDRSQHLTKATRCRFSSHLSQKKTYFCDFIVFLVYRLHKYVQ